jgi:hypothetical protein
MNASSYAAAARKMSKVTLESCAVAPADEKPSRSVVEF